MTITDRIIPINKYNRPGKKAQPKKICIHYTGNPNSGAENGAKYQLNVAKGVFADCGASCWTSSQYVIGIKGEIIRCVPDDEIAYAAAGNNVGVIHIEVCHSDSTGIFSEAAIKALSELVPLLMKKHGIAASGVVRHYDLTGKKCPLFYVGAARWATLKKRIIGEDKAEFEVGDIVRIIAPYAPSAYSKSAENTAAIGETRLITRKYENAPHPYRLGTGISATTGFADGKAIKKA